MVARSHFEVGSVVFRLEEGFIIESTVLAVKYPADENLQCSYRLSGQRDHEYWVSNAELAGSFEDMLRKAKKQRD